MVRTFLFCALATSAACSFGDDRRGVSADAGTDGPPVYTDHLLLSEIKSSKDDEFIEIWNPTNRDISLANYYLSDYGDYWKLPSNTLAIVQADFVVGFPMDAVIKSKQVITVAMINGAFITTFLVPPTYAVDIAADANGAKAFRSRLVSTSPTTITDTGEPIILFYWDGASDLVKDVDISFAGLISGAGPSNRLIAKQAVDGPDPDGVATSYKTESGTLGGGTSATANKDLFLSYKRRTFEIGSETQAGTGNGITGDDETSEALPSTWDGDGSVFFAPTPGTVPTI
jgi:hypothetical protein